VNKIESGVKMNADIVILVILSRNVEGVRNVVLRVSDVHVFAGSQQRLNFIF
jgi:hypothetical protein